MAELKIIFSFLTASGMTEEGAAGMMGNLQAESGCIPNRVEILCLKRLREHGKVYTDETYTAAVDSGQISRAEFLHPLPGKQYGYGLAQWTSEGRKAGLYDLAKKSGKSIGDLDTQLTWLITELKNSYKSVWKALTSTHDVQEASDIVLTRFEIPANAASMKKTRGQNGLKMYNALKTGKTEQDKSNPINAVISTAEAEIGYLEKKSAADLDSKTANAGSGNYTKYWRDVYPQFQGQPWCACFVSWCMMQTFGKTEAKRLLKHWPYTYVPTLAGMTKNKTPKIGSIICFYRNGVYAHTGIVVAVTNNLVTTIEGNTSGASGIIPNGGGVCRKSYNRSLLSAKTLYFMPDYKVGKTVPATEPKKTSGGISTAPKWVGKVTANELSVRAYAGTEYPQIKSYPILKKGNLVDVCDSLKANDGSLWYYVRIAGKIFGFVSANYIKKV